MSRPQLILTAFVGAFAALGVAGSAHAISVNPPPNGGGGWQPPTTVYQSSGPAKPAYFSVGPNKKTAGFIVNASWMNASDAGAAVLYRGPSIVGPWSNVASMAGTLATNTYNTLSDTSPPIDGQACYLVGVADSWGTTYSDVLCLFTPDGKNRKLWRATLHVDIAEGVSDAGTDSYVGVRLNSPPGPYLPNGNLTWIETPADDFASGSSRDYELLTKGVGGDVSDVKMIDIVVDGDDAMCVQRVRLDLDETTMFVRDFGSCVWVSSASPLIIGHDELRASPVWQSAIPATPPPVVAYDLMDVAATAAVGNAMHGSGAYLTSWPRTVASSPTTRDYYWNGDAYGLPVTMHAQLAVDTTCNIKRNRQIAKLYVSQSDVHAQSLPLFGQIFYEGLVQLFAPSSPTGLFAQTQDLGTCDQDYYLCFGQNGLGPRAGGCF